MSSLEKKIEEELERIEKAIEKEIKIIEKKAHQHNLFPIAAGGMAVFFLMVSMVVAAPYMLLFNTAPSYRAHEYTPLEARGRELYMSLGCFYCHSQFTRPTDWATGNTSLPGDFAYDSPHSLGTERTGPDLSQIGGKRPSFWHYIHDRDPRAVSPGSLMPNFGFLTDEDIEALTAYIQHVGGENLNPMDFQPYAPTEYLNASNPYRALMLEVAKYYDRANDNYTGDALLGAEWDQIFNYGKTLFVTNCLSCHGCSGNAQGPYARQTVTRPANLNERIKNYPGDFYHFWRVSEGVPGTAMPAWKLSLNETDRWQIATYEMSFVLGAVRTTSGDISDAEGDLFANTTLNSPPVNGTQQDFESGKSIFLLYCAQCHGTDGQGDGPASIKTPGGYIDPEPANFTESGGDFQLYGRYVWKVREGVETTNMPPWKYVLLDDEIYKVVFYVQAFSPPEDYNTKWAPQYTDPFAQNLKKTSETASMIPAVALNLGPGLLIGVFLSLMLWGLRHQLFGSLIGSKTRNANRSFSRRRHEWT